MDNTSFQKSAVANAKNTVKQPMPCLKSIFCQKWMAAISHQSYAYATFSHRTQQIFMSGRFILGQVRTGNHALEQVNGNSHRPQHVHAGTAELARIQPLLTCTQPANYTHKWPHREWSKEGWFYKSHMCMCVPSVLWFVVILLWCFGLGIRKSIRPVKKLSNEVLVWLSVCSEVQMICIWSSWCHCRPIIS